MYLMMEKATQSEDKMERVLLQLKLTQSQDEKYIYRERSSAKQPIQEVFSRVNEKIIQSSDKNEENIPFHGELTFRPR